MADAVESGKCAPLPAGTGAMPSDSSALAGYESGDEGGDIETSGREPSASPDGGGRDEGLLESGEQLCSEGSDRQLMDESSKQKASNTSTEAADAGIPPVGPDSAYLGDVETESGGGYSSRADTSERSAHIPVVDRSSREWYQMMRGERPPESLMTSANETQSLESVRRKVAMGLHVCSRFRRHGAISPVQAAVLKDLILGEDERVIELLEQLESGAHRHHATKELLSLARALA